MDTFYFYVLGSVFHTALTIPCSLLVSCWERADLMALLYVVFLVFCHVPIWCPR